MVVNPTAPKLVPFAPLTLGTRFLSMFVSLSLSKVFKLMQLREAPVSSSALIFTLCTSTGKTVPVFTPSSIVQMSVQWGPSTK